ncbi:MAG: leucine-rich repeat protein [Treponema sp.]|nr:leucine-rich repeat protein [Treponema sp.]
MKRNIFKAFVVMAALALASCSMFNTDKKDDVGTDTKEAYITIGLNQAGRTALPEVSDADDFDSFTLRGMIKPAPGKLGNKKEYGTWSTDATSTAYTKMTAAKIAVTSGKTYIFILTATKGGAIWGARIEKTIETGENSLSFTLELSELSNEGSGSLDVTLSVPSVVKAVDAELFPMDEYQTITPEDAALTFADGKAKYTASEIAAGNYVLVYTLYGDTQKITKLGEWREYAGITKEVKSSSNPVIESADDLANIYTITFNTNGGTLNGTAPGSYTSDYTRYSDPIPLPYNAIRYDSDGKLVTSDDSGFNGPIFSRKNYIFEGWFDAETGGNKVDYIPGGSTGDITLYARWTDTFTVDVDSYDDVDVFGEYLGDSLWALLQSGFDSIKLKLTNMADPTPMPDLSLLEDEQAKNLLMEPVDEIFTAILDAICAVQGEINIIDEGDEENTTGRNKFTYTGLGINLDLSETSLTYLPCKAFTDFEGMLKFAGSNNIEDIKMPVNLIGITLPKALTAIFPMAFYGVGFTEITIPKSVTFIQSAFTYTQGMTVNFESGSNIEDFWPIANGIALVKINIPASVKNIMEGAFSNEWLEEIIFDQGSKLETIGKQAFYKNALESITLPATLKEISDEAFKGCTELATINFEGTTAQWAAVTRGTDWHEGVPATTKVTCSDGTVSMDYGIYSITVANCTNGTVEANTTEAYSGAEITLTITPDDGYIIDSISVTAGGEPVELSGTGASRTFIMPTSNVNVTATFKELVPITLKASELDKLNEKLLEMKDNRVSSITVKITDMEDAKPALDWSTLDMESEEAGDDYMDDRFETISTAICNVPELNVKLDLSGTSLTYLPVFAFADDEMNPMFNLIEVTLPQSLTAILPYSFVLPGFNEFTIPKNVTYIYIPFISLQPMTINFENGSCIKTIGKIGHELCSIPTITIPAGVEEIEDDAFSKTSLETITFEEGSQLKTIGKDAFCGTSITEIKLPATLTNISDNAFDTCLQLATIIFEGTKEQWAAITRGTDWHKNVPATTVSCSDGTVDLDFCYLGTKFPSVAKAVGDIVFNDGSAMPYSEFENLDDDVKDKKKVYAIALIFYSGTGLNSPDAEGNEDNTTVRTLGVGLKHAGMKWCIESANAYDNNIVPIQCNPDYSGSPGNYTWTGDHEGNRDKNGSDNLEQIGAWLTKENKIDDTTGDGASDRYPALYFAKNYKEQKIGIEEASRIPSGSDYENGWYLPSLAELFQIYANGMGSNKVFDIDTVSNTLGGDQFYSEDFCCFCSSSQDSYDSDEKFILAIDFKYKREESQWKDNVSIVCAIREF